MFSWESMHSVRVGGISPHVTFLAESLARKGHEVHIFTRPGWMRDYDFINGVHYQRCPHDHSGGIIQQMNSMCESMVDRFYAVEHLFGEFDVLHLHDWHPVLAMHQIKNGRDIPWVMTYHSTEYGRNGNVNHDSPECKEISHREWLGGYESSQIITTSPHMVEELKFVYQFLDDKTFIVPNGVNSIRKDVDAGEVKKRYSIHPLAPLILFAGRMTYQKGPDLLVSSINQVLDNHWDAKFVFIGEGDMRHACQDMAYMQGVSDSCRFLGYVDDADLVDLMNACDIFCAPSRNEPFGIVILEAWSASKPVVGTHAHGIIDDFVDGIRAHFSPESIAWCLNALLNEPETRERMGEKGRAKVKREFSWDRIGDETLKVYREVL
ncbi:glycosyltransferase family 4 protein [archaeon]|nr:glycosyltransferase family 4 protein [archaeon]